ncbi:T9SS type A sorting domain-containing protein [Mesoflavibacter sp.]|uniref:T9SS type A sorting domain-containing protein n=1 Tax=Mesoflavibacter sp. TaxID=1930902 RepID=UPI003515F455
MTRQLLLLFIFFISHTIIAQTDEALGATPILESLTYECENEQTGDFYGFTKSSEFTTCPSSDYDNWVDSWYSFTPTQTQDYAIKIEELSGNTLNVRIGVYSGSVGNLTSMTGCSTRYFSATLVMGQTYYINTRGANESTEYRLCVYPLPDAPSNDEPSTADELSNSTYEVCQSAALGYTTNATHSNEAECSNSNPDVWYTFTAPETGEYTFKADLVNGSTPLYLAIYSGTPGFLNPFQESPTSPLIQCQDIILADLVANQTYYVSVTSSNSSQAIYFNLCAYKSPEAPSNDDCFNPIPLTIGQDFENSYIVATTTSATVNSGNTNFPNCGTLPDFGIYGKDVWFSVVVPPSGNFTIETRAEPTETNLSDTAMETFTGSCGTETLQPYYYNIPPPNTGTAYCNNQFVIGGDPFAGILFTNKTPGETVLIRVWGWAYQFGKFRIGAYDATLSTTEFDLNNFKYYPNPVNDVINIKYNKNITDVTVYNLLGKAVLKEETDSQLVKADLSNLQSGFYIINVTSEEQSTKFKIIKK